MGSIGRYIFRTTFGAFLLVLVSLTAVIWVTQALRDIDLMTSQGQTILVFVGITGLIIPLLVLVIAPIALVIAVAHVLNKLTTDSEIIVMNAAGMSPWVLFRAVPCRRRRGRRSCVTAISAYFAPEGPAHAARLAHRGARRRRHQHRAARPLHHDRERRRPFTSASGGRTASCVGIFARRPARSEASASPSSRRHGEIARRTTTARSWCCENGSVQRHEAKQRDPTIVVFDRYAFDLSQFAGGRQAVKYSVRERYLWQLMFPDPKDPLYLEQPGQFRAELHDRLIAPLYPFAFVVIAFAFLGAPRTTRQSRTHVDARRRLAASALLRLIGFASHRVRRRPSPWMLSLQYVALVVAIRRRACSRSAAASSSSRRPS